MLLPDRWHERMMSRIAPAPRTPPAATAIVSANGKSTTLIAPDRWLHHASPGIDDWAKSPMRTLRPKFNAAPSAHHAAQPHPRYPGTPCGRGLQQTHGPVPSHLIST